MADIKINTQVSVETQQAKARLDSFLQNSSKWNSKMAKQLSLDVQFLFPSESEVAKQFEKYRRTAQTQFSKMNWEFMYYSKNGKETGSQKFNGTNVKLDYATAVNELKRLQELKERIQSGRAISYGDWTEKDTKALEKLILNLEKTTKAFEQLQRTRSKNITRETTAAANKEVKEQNDIANAMKRVVDVQKQIARERTKNSRGGGQSLTSIYRQIDLYHQLEEAAIKAGNAQVIQYARNQIGALNKQADALERVNKIWGRQGRIMTGLQSIAARYFSIYTVANFARKVAETTGYFQQQQVALEGILGSAAKARDTLAEIKNFALQSPFQTKELVTFTKQLAAFGVGNNDLFPTVKKLADISSGLGVDMSRIILAYGQVKSAAVLRGQELRQFTEAGIPMVQKLADKFTELNGKLVTTGEVFKLISERQVPFEMVAQVLSDMTAEGGQFYKMQENITNTTYGQIQKLRDLWTIAMDDMGKAASGPINTILKGMQNIVKNIQPIFVMLSSTVIGSALGRGITALYRMIRALKIMRVAAIGVRGAMTTLLGGIGLVVGAIVGWAYNSKQKSNELKRAMDEVANAYDKDTRKMTQGIDSLVYKFSSATAGTKKFSDAASTLVSNYGKYLSSDITEAILKQGDAAQEAANKFLQMADSIKSAITAEQEWRKTQEKGETAAEKAGQEGSRGANQQSFEGPFDITKSDVLSYILNEFDRRGNIIKKTPTTLNEIEAFEKKNNVSHKTMLSEVSDVYGNVLQEVSTLGYEFDKSVGAIKDKLVGRLQAKYGKQISEETWNVVADNAIEKTNQEAKDAFNEAASNYNLAKSQVYAMLLHPFDKFDEELKEYIGTGKDFLEEESIKYQRAFDYLKYSMGTKDSKGNPIFAKYEGSALQKLIEIPEGQEHATEDAYNVVEAIKEFKKTFKGEEDEPILSGYLDIVDKRFQQYVELRKAQSAKITDAFNDPNSKVYKWRDDKDLKNIVATYANPTVANLYEKREQLAAAYSAQVDKIKKLEDVPNLSKYWKEELVVLRKQRDAMKVLMGGDLYATEEKKKRGGAGAGGGWRRLFSDLFGYIKEARAEEKKLIEHSAGNTKALAEQIGSEQLAGTAVRAFWDGTPFGKFINKMDEYGLESDVFSKDFLKEELGNIVSQMLEETDTIDYKDVWEKLIAVIRDRKDALKGDKKMESTVDAMENYLAQMVMEQEKFFGRLDVEQFIKDQINTMNRINANVEAIRTRRDLFGKIAGSSNYLAAQAAIYGAAPYRTYLNSETTRNQIMRLMGEGIGSGVSATNSGIAMWQLLQGGNMNIANLGELVRIIEELRNEISDMNPSDYEAMKGSLSQFDGLIKQLMNDIINEFEELMRFKDPITSGMDDIVNAFKSLNDAMTRINAGEGNGTLTQGQANRMRINALQAMYQTVSGVNLPSYITTLFGAMNNNGISGNGLNMASWLSDNPAVANFGRQQAALLQEEQKDIEDYYDNAENFVGMSDKLVQTNKNRDLQNAAEKAAEAVNKFAERIEMTTKIIDKVDSYVQQASKAANDILDAIESTNGLVRDNNGNYSYEMDLEQARNSVNLISQFSSDLSDSLKSFVTGDIFGGLMGLVSMITNFFKNIVTMSEKPQRDKQQQLIASNKALERALNNLQHAIDDVAGKDKWDNLFEQIKNLRDQQSNLNAAADIEEGFKHGDAEKAESLRDQAEEAGRQAEDIIRGIREEILGTADELAQSLTDAFVDAFQNGKNAAREWRDTVRGYISQMLKDNLLEKVLAPRIDKILGSFGISEDSDADSLIAMLSDPDRMTNLRNALDAEGTWMTNWLNSLPKAIQEMIGWNSSTSELSGGIQSITEDTGRTLEGLANSMLAQMIIANRNTESISGITQAQLGELKTIRVQAEAIAKASGIIQGILEGSRDGTRYLHVQMH